MRAGIAAIVLLAVLLGLLLFGSGEPVPVGTFRGAHPIPVAPGTDPVVAAQLRRVILRIDADAHAEMEDGGLPWEGHVTRHDGRLRFEVIAIAGKNIERQPAGTPRALLFDVLPGGRLRYEDAELSRSADSR